MKKAKLKAYSGIMSKDLENRKVLRFFLKAGVLLVVRISVGRLFQAVGPATLNARTSVMFLV